MNRHRPIVAATALVLSVGLVACSAGVENGDAPAAEPSSQDATDPLGTEEASQDAPDTTSEETSQGASDAREPGSGDTSVPEPADVFALPPAASPAGVVLVHPEGPDCHILVFHSALELLGTYADTPGGANGCYGERTYSPDFDVHVAEDNGVFVQRIGEAAQVIDNGRNMQAPAIGPDGDLYARTSEPPVNAMMGVLTRMTLEGDVVEELPRATLNVAWVAGKMIDSADLPSIASDESGAPAVELLPTAGGTFRVGALEQLRDGGEWAVSGDLAEIEGPGAFAPPDWIEGDRFLSVDDMGTLYTNVVDLTVPTVVVDELASLPAGYSPVDPRAVVCRDEAFLIAGAEDDSGDPVSALVGVDLESGATTTYASLRVDESTPGSTLRPRVLACVE